MRRGRKPLVDVHKGFRHVILAGRLVTSLLSMLDMCQVLIVERIWYYKYCEGIDYVCRRAGRGGGKRITAREARRQTCL